MRELTNKPDLRQIEPQAPLLVESVLRISFPAQFQTQLYITRGQHIPTSQNSQCHVLGPITNELVCQKCFDWKDGFPFPD